MLTIGAMQALLEHGLGFIELELGFEVVNVARQRATIGTAPGVGKVKGFIDHLLTSVAPAVMAC